MPTDNDPRQRFSSRVNDYVGFRPGYPDALLDAVVGLVADCTQPVVADIGAGSGIFTRALLARVCRVYAVEPNAEMRAAAEETLGQQEGFISCAGGAEDTGLDPASIDLITAAQAFHWFNNADARREFERILKPGGRVALIWNRRRLEQDFQRAYDRLLRQHAPEYGKVNHMSLGAEQIGAFLHPGKLEFRTFDNRQRLDFDGLLGRLHSSSYCPPPDSEHYARLVTALRDLFGQHAQDGIIDFEYDCELYCGGFET